MTKPDHAFKKVFKLTSFKVSVWEYGVCICIHSTEPTLGVNIVDQAVLAQLKCEEKIDKNDSMLQFQ